MYREEKQIKKWPVTYISPDQHHNEEANLLSLSWLILPPSAVTAKDNH